MIDTKYIYNNTFSKNTNTYNKLVDAASSFQIVNSKSHRSSRWQRRPLCVCTVVEDATLSRVTGRVAFGPYGPDALAASLSFGAYARESEGRQMPSPVQFLQCRTTLLILTDAEFQPEVLIQFLNVAATQQED